MSRKYKYTFFTVFLALAFSFGSMKAMDFILKVREQQLLEEKGTVLPDVFVLEWQEKDDLTVHQVEETVKCWEESVKFTTHNPVSGQISIEQAIKESKSWMKEMSLGISEWGGNDVEIDLGAVNAVLGTIEEETGRQQAEPQNSFWKVEFSNHSIQGILYVNAVTGKIWFADITLFEYLPDQMPYWKLKYFLELAGLQATHKGSVQNSEKTESLWKVKDSQLCAKMEFLRTLDMPADEKDDEKGQLDVDEKKQMKECVKITFKLSVSSS